MLFWEVKLMPWYVKKHFVNEMPSDFSAEEMLRLFQEKLPEEKKGFFGDIVEIDNPALVKFFWDNCDTDDRKTLLSAKIDTLLSYNKRSSVNLTKDDINFMLDNNMSELMDKYLKYRTPSAEIFKAMMDKVDDSIICDRLVANLIEREGLSSDLISWVYSVGSEKLKNIVEHALLVHGQKDVTKKYCGFYKGTDAGNWKAFCEETTDICAEAQMEMNHEPMVSLFYETGHHMDERAIFYWLSQEKFVNHIFSNEPEFGLISSRIKALVNGSERLSRDLVSAKKVLKMRA
jgi:proteasome lid subunit RPN8/RPN11